MPYDATSKFSPDYGSNGRTCPTKKRLVRGLTAPITVPFRLLAAGLPLLPMASGRLSRWKDKLTRRDKKGKKGKGR